MKNTLAMLLQLWRANHDRRKPATDGVAESLGDAQPIHGGSTFCCGAEEGFMDKEYQVYIEEISDLLSAGVDLEEWSKLCIRLAN